MAEVPADNSSQIKLKSFKVKELEAKDAGIKAEMVYSGVAIFNPR